MNKASTQSLILSLAILTIGTVGGALIAQKIAEGDAGLIFLWFGCTTALAIFFLQLIVLPSAKIRLFFQLLYLGFFGFSMTWFMLSLSLPIFFVNEIGIEEKLILALIFLTIMISNFNLGWQIFKKRWRENSGEFLNYEADIICTGDDWSEMIKSLKIIHNIFIPGTSEKWTSALSVFLIVLMILGLNLRAAYPTFSVFAWGIPATIMASYFIQISGSYFAQATQVQTIEKRLRYKMSSTS